MEKILKKILSKLLEEALSVKIHILVLVTYLLWRGKIDPSTYGTIVISIALGRVLVDSIVANRTAGKPINGPEENPDL